MELPVSKALVQLVQDTTGGSAVVAPTLGGSVPMYIFEDLGLPWIGVPIVNHDNHQHSSDEICGWDNFGGDGDLWGDFGGFELVKRKDSIQRAQRPPRITEKNFAAKSERQKIF